MGQVFVRFKVGLQVVAFFVLVLVAEVVFLNDSHFWNFQRTLVDILEFPKLSFGQTLNNSAILDKLFKNRRNKLFENFKISIESKFNGDYKK